MEAGGGGGSGYLSRWREDDWGEKAGWGITATMTVCEFNEQIFQIWSSTAAGKITKQTRKWHNGRPSLWLLFCVCAIRWGKHSDISRPSYSNQKIKVPFLPAVATNLNQPHNSPPPPPLVLIVAELFVVGVTVESRILILSFCNVKWSILLFHQIHKKSQNY